MEVLSALYERARIVHRAEDEASRPLTIGDVYQRLIPYRSVRAELGILEFAAYEHALLRLLAGEGGFVEILDAKAHEEIQRELNSANPILGIYRDYADSPIALLNGRSSDVIHPHSSEEASRGDSQRDSSMSGSYGAPVAEAASEPLDQVPEELRLCRSCRIPLPGIASLRFCPFCGSGQGPHPCRECGTLVEEDWSFCVRCGTASS